MKNKRYWFVFLPLAPIIGMQMIAPLIVAGVALLQGLMSQKAKEEAERKKMAYESQQQAYQTQAQAQQVGLEGKQRAYQSLMNAYQAGMIR